MKKYVIKVKIIVANYIKRQNHRVTKAYNYKDINYLNSIIITNNIDNNWDYLWSTKIDYLEYQINQSGKKYPLIVESFSYFVGLTENAISYAKNATLELKKDYNNIGVITHKKLNINSAHHRN